MLLAALLAAVTPATAATVVRGYVHGTIGGGGEPGQGINLHVERTDLDVTYADGTGGDRLEVGRIGIAWFESPAPGIRLGVSIGSQAIDQSRRAATAGLDPDGYYAEFDATGRWGLGDRFALELGGGLGYAEASDKGDAGGVELDWWRASLSPAATVLLGDRFELTAGVRLQWVDGDERVTGAAPATVNFEQDGVAGGFIALGLHTGNGGRVRLRADAGPARGLRLVFERRY